MKRLLYLTQWFEPEPTPKGVDFVHAVEGAGYYVKVATGFPNYPGGKVYPGYRIKPWSRESLGGVNITRLPLYPSHSSSSLGRMANYLSFFLSALGYGLIRGHRYDMVYVYHPPITVGAAAALFCGLWRRPFVLEIQDLWPDSINETGMANPRLVRIIDALCRFVYRRAAVIVTQSAGMRARLIARGVAAEKLYVIRNWTDEAAAAPPADLPERTTSDRFTFFYAGNLGRVQSLEIAVKAALMAHAVNPRIELVLMGDGIERETLRTLIETHASGVARLLPPVPMKEVAAATAHADALLIHLADRPLFEVTIPSKTQFYLASGKPIVAGLGGEAAELIRTSGAGLVAPSGDARALSDIMLQMAAKSAPERHAMAACGRAFYTENLSFTRGMREILTVLDRVAGRSSSD